MTSKWSTPGASIGHDFAMAAHLEIELLTLQAQVQSHRNAGVPEDVIADLPSGKRLAEISASDVSNFSADIEHLEMVVAAHRHAGFSVERAAATEAGLRLRRLRSLAGSK